MRTALVTGSAGFLGRHLAAELERRGWVVNRVDIAGPAPRSCRDLTRGSVRRYDLVVHAAAVAPHRAAIDGQPHTSLASAAIDAEMLEWAARTRQGHLLYLSSSAVYPAGLQSTGSRRRLVESDADVTALAVGQPDAAYGRIKLSGEWMVESVRAAGVPVTVVRPFSGYGSDQGEAWPFGAFVARGRRREDPFAVWGDGTQVRDWVHVSDVVGASLALVDAGVDGPVNICTGVGTSMVDLVGMMCRQVGYRPDIKLLGGQPAGVAYRVGDPGLLHQHYRPQVDIAEGVRRALT